MCVRACVCGARGRACATVLPPASPPPKPARLLGPPSIYRKQNYTIPNALPLISVTSCRRLRTRALLYFSRTDKMFLHPETNCGLLIEIHRADDSACSKTLRPAKPLPLPHLSPHPRPTPRAGFPLWNRIFGVIFPDKQMIDAEPSI